MLAVSQQKQTLLSPATFICQTPDKKQAEDSWSEGWNLVIWTVWEVQVSKSGNLWPKDSTKVVAYKTGQFQVYLSVPNGTSWLQKECQSLSTALAPASP